jgi:hypothetical protein
MVSPGCFYLFIDYQEATSDPNDCPRIRAMPAIPPTINLSYDIGDANSLRQVFVRIENIVKRILESELDDLEHEFKRSLHFFRPEFEKQ